MGDYERGRLDFDEEDRLPWLEPAADEEEEERISPLRLLGLIIAGLALIGAVVAGIWWLQNRGGTPGGGEGTLIAAPEGNYKIAANEADAKKFQGEGDASYAASEGVARDGKIDPNRVPEAPITATRPAPTGKPATLGPGKPAAAVTFKVEDDTRPKPAAVAPKAAVGGGGMIQLGAYASQSGANEAWSKLSKRFAYLAPLGTSVEAAQVGGGTVYRLRASAGAQASMICGKLKVAGESCLVVN